MKNVEIEEVEALTLMQKRGIHAIKIGRIYVKFLESTKENGKNIKLQTFKLTLK